MIVLAERTIEHRTIQWVADANRLGTWCPSEQRWLVRLDAGELAFALKQMTAFLTPDGRRWLEQQRIAATLAQRPPLSNLPPVMA